MSCSMVFDFCLPCPRVLIKIHEGYTGVCRLWLRARICSRGASVMPVTGINTEVRENIACRCLILIAREYVLTCQCWNEFVYL